MDFISLQSRVAWGYVGTAVAIPTLQKLGINAWPVDTVLYPHHPGHGPTFRSATTAADIGALLEAAMDCINGPFSLLSGYLADTRQGLAAVSVLEKARAGGRTIPFYLDPVFGDDPEGIYVDPSLVTFFQTTAIPVANLVMPNRFELSTLTGMTVDTPPEAVKAARRLIGQGPELVLVSSVPAAELIANILVSADAAWICRVEKRPLLAKGTGDMFSAAFSGLLSSGLTPPAALAKATAIVQFAVDDCSKSDARELNLPYILNHNLVHITAVPIDTLEI